MLSDRMKLPHLGRLAQPVRAPALQAGGPQVEPANAHLSLVFSALPVTQQSGTLPAHAMIFVEVEVKTKVRSTRRRLRKRVTPAHARTSGVPGKTIQELARERGAKPFDPQAFAGIVPPDEEIGAFVEEIYRART